MKLAVIGLGYVGLPLAVAFAEKGVDVVGFDINQSKIDQFMSGVDVTEEIGSERLIKALDKLKITNKVSEIKNFDYYIVAVPTPISIDKIPDLTPVERATETVGKAIGKNSIVVFESTVYPGTTEEICVPILEKHSNLKCGIDFKVGYSPERINPGDKVNTLEKIIKIVSGMDSESLDNISCLYETIIEAGVYRAESIKVAEAAKVIENSQRDINIAFVNELAMAFDHMDIDTQSVLKAAGTKWNFLNFSPGLVGGHCIGVDPYYFTYKAKLVGYESQIISSGRTVNDRIGQFVAEKTVKMLIKSGVVVKDSTILILGLTFKENVGDLRNSRVIDIIKELNDYGIKVLVNDPVASKEAALNEFGLSLVEWDDIENIDIIITAVAHEEYKKISSESFRKLYCKSIIDKPPFIDVKGIYSKEIFSKEFDYWRL